MTVTDVDPTLTFVKAYKQGEMLPQMRKIALDNIRFQRGRGMPRDLDAFEVGINVCINGRHFEYLGTTVGVPKGSKPMRPCDIFTLVGRMVACELKRQEGSGNPRFTENEQHLFFKRDTAL